MHGIYVGASETENTDSIKLKIERKSYISRILDRFHVQAPFIMIRWLVFVKDATLRGTVITKAISVTGAVVAGGACTLELYEPNFSHVL